MTSSKHPVQERQNEFKQIASSIGFALITWQDVEEAHFKLFVKMLGAPREEICSVIYYSVQSFESRHIIVGRMAHFFLEGRQYKKQRGVWQNLQKRLKDANEDRNKLAHYNMGYDLVKSTKEDDGAISFEYGPPRLRPSAYDKVSSLLGRTPDKDQHNLSAKDLAQYFLRFHKLFEELTEFRDSLSLPPPQQGLDYVQGLLRFLESPDGSGQLESTPTARDLPRAE